MFAAIALITVLGGLAVFQIALVCGAPFGRFAYGGQHERELPKRLRISSAIAVLIYVAVAVIVLDRVSVVEVFPAIASQIAMWVLFAMFVIATVPNAISRSRSERYVMTPITLVLAVLALLTALSPPPTSSGSSSTTGPRSTVGRAAVVSYASSHPALRRRVLR